MDRMDSRNRAERLLALSLSLGLAIGGPYSGLGMRIPKGKSRGGHLIGCHVCGATWKTLYKDGDQRICGECRKKGEDGR